MDLEKRGEISDGHHTFNELYAHRRALFFALCRTLKDSHTIWRSKLHAEGESEILEGVFIAGINTEPGTQISYHILLEYWDESDFAETLVRAPKWDGHTSEDVLRRLKEIK